MLLILIALNSLFLKSGYNKILTRHINNLESKIQSLNNLVDVLKETYPWVIPCEEIKKIEKNAREIWICTPDLHHDETNFYEVVKSNIETGKRYRYLIPNNDTVIAKFNAFKQSLKSEVPGMTDSQIDSKICDFPFLTEIVIYNPLSLNPQAILVSPQRESCYSLLCDKTKTDEIRGIFESLFHG